jgi:hypothetical protein
VSELIARHRLVGNFASAAFMISAAWATGQAIRARRLLTTELRRTSARLAAEREHRAAGGSRRAFTDRARAARGRGTERRGDGRSGRRRRAMLVRDPARADASMAAIEDTGRQTLAEMRRILGVLRPRRRSREARAATRRRSDLRADPTRARSQQ